MPRAVTLAIVVVACLVVAMSTIRAGAQPFPQSPRADRALVGERVTVHLQNNTAVATSRTRESVGQDPLVRINETPISVTGRVASFASEGGGRWVVIARQDAGNVWIPLDSIHLIEVRPE